MKFNKAVERRAEFLTPVRQVVGLALTNFSTGFSLLRVFMEDGSERRRADRTVTSDFNEAVAAARACTSVVVS